MSSESQNPKRSLTPFQELLIEHLRVRVAALGGSGRALSLQMGKSASHMSQIINDGLVPSGPSIIEMAGFLGLNRDETDGLIRSAMLTKMEGRSRDSFWLRESERMLAAKEVEIDLLVRFLHRSGLYDDYLAWRDANRNG